MIQFLSDVSNIHFTLLKSFIQNFTKIMGSKNLSRNIHVILAYQICANGSRILKHVDRDIEQMGLHLYV